MDFIRQTEAGLNEDAAPNMEMEINSDIYGNTPTAISFHDNHLTGETFRSSRGLYTWHPGGLLSQNIGGSTIGSQDCHFYESGGGIMSNASASHNALYLANSNRPRVGQSSLASNMVSECLSSDHSGEEDRMSAHLSQLSRHQNRLTDGNLLKSKCDTVPGSCSNHHGRSLLSQNDQNITSKMDGALLETMFAGTDAIGVLAENSHLVGNAHSYGNILNYEGYHNEPPASYGHGVHGFCTVPVDAHQRPLIPGPYFVRPTPTHNNAPMVFPFNILSPELHGPSTLQPVSNCWSLPFMSNPSLSLQSMTPNDCQAQNPSNYPTYVVDSPYHKAFGTVSFADHSGQIGRCHADQAGLLRSSPVTRAFSASSSRIAPPVPVVRPGATQSTNLLAQGVRSTKVTCPHDKSATRLQRPPLPSSLVRVPSPPSAPKRKLDSRRSMPLFLHEKKPKRVHMISSAGSSSVGYASPAGPLGERCQLCNIDLAFKPAGAPSDSHDLPVHAVLPCAHCFHDSCLVNIYGSSEEPPCFLCSDDGRRSQS